MFCRQNRSGRGVCDCQQGPEEPQECRSHLRLNLESEDKLADWMPDFPRFPDSQALLSRQSKGNVYLIRDKSWKKLLTLCQLMVSSRKGLREPDEHTEHALAQPH